MSGVSGVSKTHRRRGSRRSDGVLQVIDEHIVLKMAVLCYYVRLTKILDPSQQRIGIMLFEVILVLGHYLAGHGLVWRRLKKSVVEGSGDVMRLVVVMLCWQLCASQSLFL